MATSVTRLLTKGIQYLAAEGTIEQYMGQVESARLSRAEREELYTLLDQSARLLRLAQVPVPSPTAQAANRARFLSAAAQYKEESRARAAPGWLGVPARLWRSLLSTTLVLSLLLVMVAGAANVAAGSLPGSPLYPLKLAAEDVRLGLTVNPPTRAQLYMRFATERSAEMVRLASAGRRVDPTVLPRMAQQWQGALETAGSVSAEVRRPLLEQLMETSSEEGQTLRRASAEAPPESQAVLNAGAAIAEQTSLQAQQVLQSLVIPSATPTPTATWTATVTTVPSETEPVPTQPPVVVPVASPTATCSPTVEPATPSTTPGPAISEPTSSPSPSRTRTLTPQPPATPTETSIVPVPATGTPTHTLWPTRTSSPRPTNTATPRPTYTQTPRPTYTQTPRPTYTATATASPVTPTPSNTPQPTDTPQAVFHLTNTAHAGLVPATHRIHYVICVVNQGGVPLTNVVVVARWSPPECVYLPPQNPPDKTWAMGTVNAHTGRCVFLDLNTYSICGGRTVTNEATMTCDQGTAVAVEITRIGPTPMPTGTVTMTATITPTLTLTPTETLTPTLTVTPATTWPIP